MYTIWPAVRDDELELILLYKWFHNVFEWPIYVIVRLCINPFLVSFVEPMYEFFLYVNFKWNFLYCLAKKDQNSLFLSSLAKFIINTELSFNNTVDLFSKGL